VVIGHTARARALERRAYQQRAFYRRCNDDRFAAYLRILVVESVIFDVSS